MSIVMDVRAIPRAPLEAKWEIADLAPAAHRNPSRSVAPSTDDLCK
jgi:hypothetical protein